MPLDHSVNFRELDQRERRWILKMKDIKKPLYNWILGVAYRIGQAWNITYQQLFSGSVTFRGESTWGSVRPMYTRITDGMAVPPWGGVSKLHGGGAVLGRLRRSGQRVSPSSVFGADTSELRSSFLTGIVFGYGGFSVKLTTHLMKAFHFNNRAPFAFLNHVDKREFNAEMEHFVAKNCREF
jgi:hypothetical protein